MGTDVAVRGTLDLTRAPDEQWNAEMVAMVTKSVFRGMEVTKSQLYYCLAVADGVGLNPLVGEVYFIPSKSRDGKGPAFVPYVGRNGLVKKANERDYYYEVDVVHENDRFRMSRRRDGTFDVTHSYGAADRGEIVGAYAFLHDATGRRKPAFFYAKLSEYLPSFDAEWKMGASPWGNQRSAMIAKSAMIGAGRQRLDLGNVLADGELARVEQMQQTGPRSLAPPAAGVVDFSEFTQDEGLAERLRAAVSAAGWPSAKVEMLAAGLGDAELVGLAERAEAEAGAGAAVGPQEAVGGDGAAEEVTDAEVVAERSPEKAQRLVVLRRRRDALEGRLAAVSVDEREHAEVSAEVDAIDQEIAMIEADQPGLFG